MPEFQPHLHFTVSQIRVAAMCPRIFYFDQLRTREKKLKYPYITRIWEKGKGGDVVTAAGSLFHNTIESFNKSAAKAPQVLTAIQNSVSAKQTQRDLAKYLNLNCLNRESLGQYKPPTIQAFSKCVLTYLEELSNIVHYARSVGHPAEELIQQLFGDSRKQVDMTFYVGPHEEPVHVTGRLDYVFYDWRTKNHRIFDYKLTPAEQSQKDTFQVATYALMHHFQHKTSPDASVYYLHPEKKMISLEWDTIWKQRGRVYNLLSSMVEWSRYQADGGFLPPGVLNYCDGCPWDKFGKCEKELGPKSEGVRCQSWKDEAVGALVDEPVVEAREPEAESINDVQNAAATTSSTMNVVDEPVEVPVDSPQKKVAKTNSKKALESGLLIGRAGNADVRLPTQEMNTHIAVVGAAGSGKTWFAKVIAEEAIRNGVPVLAIDPQGDLVQFLKQNDRSVMDPEYLAHYDEFCEKVETKIYTPGSSHGERLSLAPMRMPKLDELNSIGSKARRDEVFTDMLSANASNLVSLANIGGEEESQKTFLFQVLKALEKIKLGDLELTDVISGLTAPDSVGIDDPDMYLKKSEREKLVRKLNNFIEGPASKMFTKGTQLDLGEMLKSANGKTPLNVIYLNALTNDEEKQFFVAMLASEIYRYMVTSLESTGQPNLLFYIDEARDYMPAGTSKPPAKEPLLRLFTQGRKYGVGCLLCTQSPRSVDHNAFGNCSSKFIGRMESAQDIARIEDWFTMTGAAPKWIKERKGAGKGTFVGRWPDMPESLEGTAFQSRKLFSVHEGAWSPDRVEEECNP